MYFTLLLLFCSLISVSISINTIENNPNVHRARSREEVDALVKGQIIAVEPINFLNEDREKKGSKYYEIHPAIFVDIAGDTVRVVVMASGFTTENVPQHLTGLVSEYFDEGTKFNALGYEKTLTGVLDLSKYRQLEWMNIVIPNEGESTTMKEDNFEAMNRKINSNLQNGNIKPYEPEDGKSKKLASAPPSLNDKSTKSKSWKDNVKDGEIVYIKFTTPRPGSRPAIFVSWTGDRTLAVVSISTTQRAQKTADIGDYDFTVEKKLHGKISLEGYQTVHLDDVIFDRNKKTRTMMKPESFRQLRNQIDTNIRIARGDSSK